eukprot:TRINITY_DN7283_c0_g1_i2.p1 TRINITY_DN7283_c0_g1~~TRINITY_DN7283_c0_g1_i2.p1  ORF type:complete len:1042 (-),score=227.88 TRINITY_DN7283_c0_g1_i2:442-3567(-)
MWNFVCTASKPTAVTHSVTGNFTSPSAKNLIISKCTRIEIHLLTPEGLRPLHDVPINGRIAIMELFRPQGESQDLLFFTTERYKFGVLAYDEEKCEIITRAYGDLEDRIAQESSIGPIGDIDPDCRMIGLHFYEGLYKVIPIGSNTSFKDAFNISLEELQILDIKFLYGCSQPTIAVLFQDQKDSRHVKVYEVNIKEKLFSNVLNWNVANVEGGAHALIPIPKGGLIVLGEQTVTYLNGNNAPKTIPIASTIIKAFGKVDTDGSRYLLGDHAGQFYMLLLIEKNKNNNNEPLDLKIERLGEVSIPSSISYLDNGVVYIGAGHGDSQLVKLLTEKNEETGTYITILEEFTNLGPIVDFCVVDLERQGQGQVVTCSGAFKDGSLRIIRNGIGINEQATIDLPGIKGIWSLKDETSNFDKYLVMTFINATRVLAIQGEELEETSIDGFTSESQTLYCGNVINGQIIQVTSNVITLVSTEGFMVNSTWSPPQGSSINLASCNKSQVLISIGGNTVIYLEIQGTEFKEISRKVLEHEIACLDVSPLTGENDQENEKANVCAVGLWGDISLRILLLPSLNQVHVDHLGGEIIPRSVLFASFEGLHYVLCALGDGNLFSFVFDPATYLLSERRKIAIGTQPVILNKFRSKGTTNIFASSDRPTVIYSSNKKLMYSNVNLKEVLYMSPFNSESFPESLAIAKSSSLSIGTIDEIQKLHIRSVPLGEMPRRIAHQDQSKTFAVLTVNSRLNQETGEEIDASYIKLFNDQTFEILSTFALNQYETGWSLINTSFKEEPNQQYFVIGTAFVRPEETEPSSGRILVFQVQENKLILVTEKQVKGAAFSLNSFGGKLLSSINSKIQLFEWGLSEDGTRTLTPKCVYHGHILALYVVTRGDFIVVGDLMKSISLLVYKPVESQIEEIARDFSGNWMTCIEALDDDTFIGAENSMNLFTVRKNSEAASDEERARLDTIGEFHLGELVNRFRVGSLVMQQPDSTPLPTLLFGTVNGALGVVASLNQESFEFFKKLQDGLRKVVKGNVEFFIVVNNEE